MWFEGYVKLQKKDYGNHEAYRYVFLPTFRIVGIIKGIKAIISIN